MITIFQAYKLYQEIKYTSNQPRITFKPHIIEYRLETKNYHIIAQSHRSQDLLPESFATEYTFQATDKRSGVAMITKGSDMAQILCQQVQKNARQK